MLQKKPILGEFDFDLLDSDEFKEDSVREELVLPILRALGYGTSGAARIVRARKLKHPFIKVGSRKRPVTTIPDYIMTVNGRNGFILDAKSPDEMITDGENVEQAFSYAIHPDVRVSYFALCNGRDLTVFHVSHRLAVLSVPLQELDAHWARVVQLLGPQTFDADEPPPPVLIGPVRQEVDYLALKPPLEVTSTDRQTARRHFGVHGYFTKQPWNVVQAYVRAMTQVGDLVVDPFGGGGVTLIESMMLERRAIHVDINPLSVFIVSALITPVNYMVLDEAFERIVRAFEAEAPTTPAAIRAALKKYPHPKGIRLPRNADVDTIEELFTPKQLAQLALLRHLILRVRDKAARVTLLLMFSGLLNKINKTYHASEGRSEGRGDSGVFRYYRYRVAPHPADLDLMTYFALRYKRVCSAKREIQPRINADTLQHCAVVQGSATDLSWIPTESVDYIFTDPPYGAKIAYLDLSIMWLAWLGLEVTEKDYELEAIEGGERRKSQKEYADLISTSLSEVARILKYDRWMSFVFAHQTPSYWYLVVQAAERAGFEYYGVVRQKSGQTTFKKRQNPFTVLSGELIISFKKVRQPKTIARFQLGAPVMELVMNNVEAVIAKNNGATIEEINDELVIRGLELGFLDILAREYSDLTPILNDLYDCDRGTQRYHLRSNTKFRSTIPLELRVRYFVLSYLRRMGLEGNDPTFDDVVLHVMPLLKNGVTPERETIRKVLEDVAERRSAGRYRLSKEKTNQTQLFDSDE